MAGIVFACVVPHPPLLVPEVGGGRETEISATTRAMETLSKQLEQKRPEVLFVISPHGTSLYDAMGIATARKLKGSMRSWGARGVEHDFTNSPQAAAILQEEASYRYVPLRVIADKEYELDHGVMVPFYFLVKGVKDAQMVPLTFSWLPLSTHFAFGQAIARTAERLEKRIAIVASGDLSHRLLPSAPAGYDPMGKVFDEKLVKALEDWDTKAILGLDEGLIERAGECGLRSIVIMLGALDGLEVRPEILSYEGPFGVGYLVASFDVEPEAGTEKGARKKQGKAKEDEGMHPLAQLAKDTVEKYVRDRVVLEPRKLTPEMKERAGVFVSLKKRGELRGCIGTFEPTQANVAQEVVQNAISSATRDPRFPPVTPEECPDITYSVDVLTTPEPVESPSRLDARRYGVIVECGGRRGLLLPDLEGVDSIEEQIHICRLKAAIAPEEPIKLYRFEVKRYK